MEIGRFLPRSQVHAGDCPRFGHSRGVDAEPAVRRGAGTNPPHAEGRERTRRTPRGGTDPADTPLRPATVPKSGRFAACSRRLGSDVPIAGRFSPCKYLRVKKRPEKGSLGLARFRGQVDVFALEASALLANLAVAFARLSRSTCSRFFRRRRTSFWRSARLSASLAGSGRCPRKRVDSSRAANARFPRVSTHATRAADESAWKPGASCHAARAHANHRPWLP